MSELTLPRRFKVTYIGAGCGEEIEMYDCLFPEVKLPCEECEDRHYFYAEYVEHKSWEWELIDDEVSRATPEQLPEDGQEGRL